MMVKERLKLEGERVTRLSSWRGLQAFGYLLQLLQYFFVRKK